jgi:hypothetical protein
MDVQTDAEVVGTVCVAPRARSANRRVFFLELQGDDETRHHVLCKAAKLGGLLSDEATVHHAHRGDTYHARPCMHHTHAMHHTRAMHMRVMHRWRCTGTCGRETRWPSEWGGASCAPPSQIATAAQYMPWRLLSRLPGALARESTGQPSSSTPPT